MNLNACLQTYEELLVRTRREDLTANMCENDKHKNMRSCTLLKENPNKLEEIITLHRDFFTKLDPEIARNHSDSTYNAGWGKRTDREYH